VYVCVCVCVIIFVRFLRVLTLPIRYTRRPFSHRGTETGGPECGKIQLGSAGMVNKRGPVVVGGEV